MFTFIPITHPTSDTKHPLLLVQSAHGEKYFFGKIGEGSQRSLTENKIRISKLKDIFLTGELNWSDIGGLPGMILTIADQGKSNLVLHYGNDILNYIVSTWRYFVFRFGIDLNDHIMKDKEVYKDKVIAVKSFNVLKMGGRQVRCLR
ncbi:BAF_collapsed_G0037970.mRNA.1.CDS.1 [Saccharomyces cerevisiae]|nr:BAF_collapsed_G0037970.mRNA.1.CDS.1 [Saccharomyces cerevisiae]